MNKRKMMLIVALFALSIGITMALSSGIFNNNATQKKVSDIDSNQSRTPAPVVNITTEEDIYPNQTEFTRFQNVTTETGFNYRPKYRHRGIISQSGLYIVDYNRDHREDILATGGEYPVLFKNVGGQFIRARTFKHPKTRTAHFFDYDRDGWPDLVFAEYGGDIISYNNKRGEFKRKDFISDVQLRSPTSVTSADFTGNGCLDLFITQNGLWQQGQPIGLSELKRVHRNHPKVRPTTTGGGENILLYSDCEELQPATERAGIFGKNWTLATSAADFTGDGYIDIHVGNDHSADFLYINNGDGTFTRHDLGPKTDRNAMSSVAKDMTGDGRTDLFISNIYFPPNTTTTIPGVPARQASAVPKGNNLLINTGNAESQLFIDQAPIHDVNKGGWGWAAVVDDFNNDGHMDIIHSTSGQIPLTEYDQFRTPQVWRGTSDSWEKVNERGIGINKHQGRGMVRLDFDNDGALDFAVATTGVTETGRHPPRPFILYRNQLNSNDYLQLRLQNSGGVARHAVAVVETNRTTIQRTVTARSDFLSQNSRLIHVGLDNEYIKRIQVFWPDGSRSVYTQLQKGERYAISQDSINKVK